MVTERWRQLGEAAGMSVSGNLTSSARQERADGTDGLRPVAAPLDDESKSKKQILDELIGRVPFSSISIESRSDSNVSVYPMISRRFSLTKVQP